MIQRIGLFDSIHAFQSILNDLLEGTELLNSVQCIFICIEYSVREYQSDFSPLHWHNMPAYLYFYYAAIIDGALTNTQYLQYGYLVNSMLNKNIQGAKGKANWKQHIELTKQLYCKYWV